MEISGPLIYSTIISDFVNAPNGYLIVRMGNVEIEAILTNTIIPKLLNNAGFYYTSENTKIDEFNNWKREYIDAIKNSNCIFHVITCPSFQITMDFLTNEKIFKPILPYREDCEFYLEIIHFLTFKNNVKIGIVTYFKEDIEKQLECINKINKDFPMKKENIVLFKSYQSITGNRPHTCHSETLYTLQKECLRDDIRHYFLSCGSYGLPLGNFLKKNKKNVIYVGGILQCLFGLIGKRWADRENIKPRINEFWKTPEMKPNNYTDVENGCYW